MPHPCPSYSNDVPLQCPHGGQMDPNGREYSSWNNPFISIPIGCRYRTLSLYIRTMYTIEMHWALLLQEVAVSNKTFETFPDVHHTFAPFRCARFLLDFTHHKYILCFSLPTWSTAAPERCPIDTGFEPPYLKDSPGRHAGHVATNSRQRRPSHRCKGCHLRNISILRNGPRNVNLRKR